MSQAARKPEPDPFLEALRNVPIGPPDSDEMREIVEAANADGQRIPGHLVTAEIAERCRRGE